MNDKEKLEEIKKIFDELDMENSDSHIDIPYQHAQMTEAIRKIEALLDDGFDHDSKEK